MVKASDIPSEECLSSLRAILEENNATLGPLVSQLNSLQSDIRRIATEITYEPQNDREGAILQSESEVRENGVPDGVDGHQQTLDLDAEIRKVSGGLKGALPNEGDLEVS